MEEFHIDFYKDINDLSQDDIDKCNIIKREYVDVEESIEKSYGLFDKEISRDDIKITDYHDCEIYILRNSEDDIIGICISSSDVVWKNTYYIYYFGISKEYKGHGFGKYFMNYIIDQHKNMNIALQAFTRNTEAMALYKKFGFDSEINVTLVRFCKQDALVSGGIAND